MANDNILILKNEQFTTASLGCFLRLPLTKHNLAFASLLTKMQNNSSEQFPTIAQQLQTLDEHYNLQFEAAPQLFGNQILITYTLNFVEPIEVLDPDYTYDSVFNIFAEIIQKPNFSNDAFALAKRQLLNDYQEIMDNPVNNAMDQFFKAWYSDEPDYAYGFIGPIDDIKEATIDQLKEYAKHLQKVPAEIIGIGRDNEQMIELSQQYFTQVNLHHAIAVNNLMIDVVPKQVIEKDVNKNLPQAQLFIGYANTKQTSYREKNYRLAVSTIFGGG